MAFRLILQRIRVHAVERKEAAVATFLVEKEAFIAKTGPFLKLVHATVKDYLCAMLRLRLTNVDPRPDRHSKVMRVIAVQVLRLCRVNEPTLTDMLYASYVAVLTGGKAFAVFLLARNPNIAVLPGSALYRLHASEAGNGWDEVPVGGGAESEEEGDDELKFLQLRLKTRLTMKLRTNSALAAINFWQWQRDWSRISRQPTQGGGTFPTSGFVPVRPSGMQSYWKFSGAVRTCRRQKSMQMPLLRQQQRHACPTATLLLF